MSTTTLVSPPPSTERPSIDVTLLSPTEKKELIAADAISVASDTTAAPSTSPSTLAASFPFTPTKSLHINSKGVPILRLPLAPSELVITVHNADDSITYTSTRGKRSSGNCVLTNAAEQPLLSTTYFFGPGKDPYLTYLNTGAEEGKARITTRSKWTSRTQTFALPDGHTLTWSYEKAAGFGVGGKKRTALVASVDGKWIAALVRNEETRSAGSKSCSAGNGGELVLGECADGGVEKGGVAEEVVVATCLLMLKKEIDRRRAVQFMMISSAVSA